MKYSCDSCNHEYYLNQYVTSIQTLNKFYIYKNVYELLDSIILFDQLLSLIISNLCVYELNYLEKMFYCCFLPRAHIFFLRLRDFLAFCFKGLMRGWIFYIIRCMVFFQAGGYLGDFCLFKRDDFFLYEYSIK